MGFMPGEGRMQRTLFPVTLEELIPDDHVCGVIDEFVGRLDMMALGFERAEAAGIHKRRTITVRIFVSHSGRHLCEERDVIYEAHRSLNSMQAVCP